MTKSLNLIAPRTDSFNRTTDFIINNTKKIESTGCWEWQLEINRSGYGMTKYHGKSMRAHRLSYMLFKETPKKDKFILHKCDNRKCVNPDHLYEGTHADNMRDMTIKGRHWNSAKTTCKSGHPLTVENTYIYYRNNTPFRQCRACACVWPKRKKKVDHEKREQQG